MEAIADLAHATNVAYRNGRCKVFLLTTTIVVGEWAGLATKTLFEMRIDELCERHGETATSLSEKASLSPYTVRKWIESAKEGNNPPGRSRELRKFADRWKVSVGWLTEEGAAVPETTPSAPAVTVPERTYEPAPEADLPYAAERERAAAKLVLVHNWKLEEAVAGVRALLAFVHNLGDVTEDHFVQGALRSRAAMRAKSAGERVAKKGELVVDEDQVRKVGDVIERGAELGVALAKKKGKHGREEPRSVRKIRRASKPRN